MKTWAWMESDDSGIPDPCSGLFETPGEALEDARKTLTPDSYVLIGQVKIPDPVIFLPTALMLLEQMDEQAHEDGWQPWDCNIFHIANVTEANAVLEDILGKWAKKYVSTSTYTLWPDSCVHVEVTLDPSFLKAEFDKQKVEYENLP